MEEFKEIKMKVKVDSYKDLQNFLHNELKITKEDIEKLLEKLLDRMIKEKLSDDEFVKNHIDKVISNTVDLSMARLATHYSWKLEDRIAEVIEKAIGQKIMEKVKQQLSNISL